MSGGLYLISSNRIFSELIELRRLVEVHEVPLSFKISWLFCFFFFFCLFVSDRVGPSGAADARVRELGGYERIPLKLVNEPESLAFDVGGAGPYAGVSDGRVLGWEERSRRWVEYAVPTRDR